MSDTLTALGPLGVFILMIGTAIFPWLNAEVAVMILPSLASSRAGLAGLFALAVVGHMVGKSVIYWLSRRGGRALPARVEGILEKLRVRMSKHPSSAFSLVVLSSIVGLPPFYLVTLAAGAIRMNFGVYLVGGTIGRVVRLGVAMLFGNSLLALVKHWYYGA